jgi:hypothetical protein
LLPDPGLIQPGYFTEGGFVFYLGRSQVTITGVASSL